MMRTPFMFQQKLKLAIKNGSGERVFPMHMLSQIFSVWEVSLSRPRALGVTTLYPFVSVWPSFLTC